MDNAYNGPIEPGDLLTTSNVPGHAMKVSDYERAQGAILGKAMSSLESGRGPVLGQATEMTEIDVRTAVQTWVRFVTANAKPDAVIEKMELYSR